MYKRILQSASAGAILAMVQGGTSFLQLGLLLLASPSLIAEVRWLETAVYVPYMIGSWGLSSLAFRLGASAKESITNQSIALTALFHLSWKINGAVALLLCLGSLLLRDCFTTHATNMLALCMYSFIIVFCNRNRIQIAFIQAQERSGEIITATLLWFLVTAILTLSLSTKYGIWGWLIGRVTAEVALLLILHNKTPVKKGAIERDLTSVQLLDGLRINLGTVIRAAIDSTPYLVVASLASKKGVENFAIATTIVSVVQFGIAVASQQIAISVTRSAETMTSNVHVLAKSIRNHLAASSLVISGFMIVVNLPPTYNVPLLQDLDGDTIGLINILCGGLIVRSIIGGVGVANIALGNYWDSVRAGIFEYLIIIFSLSLVVHLNLAVENGVSWSVFVGGAIAAVNWVLIGHRRSSRVK